MDRRWNSPEQNSKQVGEDQPRRSSQHHFIYRSPETSLTSKEQINDERSDKRTGTVKLWFESKWAEKIEPQCRKAWTLFVNKNQNKAPWIKRAMTELERKCSEEWKNSSAPYDKWSKNIIESFKEHNIPYNEKILNPEWYNDWEQPCYHKFINFSQNMLNCVMEKKYMGSMQNMFIITMQKKLITENSQNMTVKELNNLFHMSTNDLREYIQGSFNLGKFAKYCLNEFTGNKQEEDQEEDQEEIFRLEL